MPLIKVDSGATGVPAITSSCLTSWCAVPACSHIIQIERHRLASVTGSASPKSVVELTCCSLASWAAAMPQHWPPHTYTVAAVA
jgi:hypothetical protein